MTGWNLSLAWLVTLGMLLLVPALTAWAPLRLAVLPATRASVPTAAEHAVISHAPVGGIVSAPLTGFSSGSEAFALTSRDADKPITTISLVLAAWVTVLGTSAPR